MNSVLAIETKFFTKVTVSCFWNSTIFEIPNLVLEKMKTGIWCTNWLIETCDFINSGPFQYVHLILIKTIFLTVYSKFILNWKFEQFWFSIST